MMFMFNNPVTLSQLDKDKRAKQAAFRRHFGQGAGGQWSNRIMEWGRNNHRGKIKAHFNLFNVEFSESATEWDKDFHPGMSSVDASSLLFSLGSEVLGYGGGYATAYRALSPPARMIYTSCAAGLMMKR